MSTTTTTPSTCLLTRALGATELRKILKQDAPVDQIVQQLFFKGAELASESPSPNFNNMEQFKHDHGDGKSGLQHLEGFSTIDDDCVVVLMRCPMADEVAKLYEDGKPPAHFKRIIDEYMVQNPGSNAILHPGCIAHQVARQMIVKDLQIKGKANVNYFQLACRSGATGKVVYDDNGLAKVGMSKETADRLIDGQACLYVIVAE